MTRNADLKVAAAGKKFYEAELDRLKAENERLQAKNTSMLFWMAQVLKNGLTVAAVQDAKQIMSAFEQTSVKPCPRCGEMHDPSIPHPRCDGLRPCHCQIIGMTIVCAKKFLRDGDYCQKDAGKYA